MLLCRHGLPLMAERRGALQSLSLRCQTLQLQAVLSCDKTSAAIVPLEIAQDVIKAGQLSLANTAAVPGRRAP